MPARLTIAPAAARDLDGVRLWLTQPGAGPAAATALREIAEAIGDLAEAPFRWAESDDHPGVRARIIQRHTIIYQTIPNTCLAPVDEVHVRVLRVFRPHQSRTLL